MCFTASPRCMRIVCNGQKPRGTDSNIFFAFQFLAFVTSLCVFPFFPAPFQKVQNVKRSQERLLMTQVHESYPHPSPFFFFVFIFHGSCFELYILRWDGIVNVSVSGLSSRKKVAICISKDLWCRTCLSPFNEVYFRILTKSRGKSNTHQ